MNTLEFVRKKYQVTDNNAEIVHLPQTRKDLANLFHELDFRTGIELGVMYGDYSKILCEANPNLHLSCIDAWELYEDLPDTEAKSGNFQRRTKYGYEHAETLLREYSCDIIKKYSMDAVRDFTRDSVDFIYIDANHTFDYVMQDIIEWTRIVKPGGIVCGHDYSCYKHPEVGIQVSTAVQTYAKMHNIKPIFLYENDNSSSWMFVK